MIRLENVNFGYRDNQLVLKNVSLSIPKAKYTCIIGHNGSGKSTISKIIIGIEEIKSGQIFVDNELLNYESLEKIRGKIGIVFQNPDNQFIGTTVEDDIAFTLENNCVPQENMQAIIETYLDQVGMLGYMHHESEKLSGGQKQRVALAGVLAGNSEIVIFDEATSMLDPEGKQEVLAFINKLHLEKQLTILSITHDMEEVLNADHVIVLSEGEVLLEGTPIEVFKRIDLLQKAKLELPFVLEVIKKAQSLGLDVEYSTDLKKVVDSICR